MLHRVLHAPRSKVAPPPHRVLDAVLDEGCCSPWQVRSGVMRSFIRGEFVHRSFSQSCGRSSTTTSGRAGHLAVGEASAPGRAETPRRTTADESERQDAAQAESRDEAGARHGSRLSTATTPRLVARDRQVREFSGERAGERPREFLPEFPPPSGLAPVIPRGGGPCLSGSRSRPRGREGAARSRPAPGGDRRRAGEVPATGRRRPKGGAINRRRCFFPASAGSVGHGPASWE